MRIFLYRSSLFNPRVVFAFSLVSAGAFLAMLAFAAPPARHATTSAPKWTQVGSYQPPIVRNGHVMAQDRTGRTLIFGGSTPGNLVYMDDTWIFNGSRWVEQQPATRPPARAFAMAAYDPIRQETVLFGGAGEFFSLADTWTWDGTAWTQRTPAISPPARSFGGMAYDPVTQKVILFGGLIDGRVALADTWSWDGTNWSLEPAVLSPSPRSAFGFADGSLTSKPVLFGGLSGSLFLGDTWNWDGLLHTWVPGAVTGPSARAGVNMARDPASGQVLLFGGFNNLPFMQSYGDTWSWDGAAWTQLNPARSPSFTTRWTGALAFDAVDQKMHLFGGLSCTPVAGVGCVGGWSNDTWGWDGSTWQKEDMTAPQELQNAMVADEVGGGMLMFGGQYEYGNYSQETWRWDGANWQALAPAHAPLPRGMGAMIYVPATGTTLLFGGAVDTVGLPGPRQVFAAQDTWTWDGIDWTELAPATSPPPRSHASIAYDASRDEVVLFGGATVQGDARGDTWVWDGSTWTERQPQVSPPARFAGHMTYDPVRGQVVLFGGSLSNNEDWLADTWVWDGENWHEVTPASSPSGRAYGGMGFDPSTAALILFGGCANCFANPVHDETWSWDGSQWTLLNLSAAPSRRTTFAMLGGNDRHPLLLFGGRRAALTPAGALATFAEGTEHTNDVWEFGAGVAPRPLEVVSRKTHGASDFEVDLPLTGNPGIECRSGGANNDYTLIYTFANPLTSVGGASVTSGTGTVSSSAIGSDPHEYIVNLTGVANAQTITLTLSGVNDGTTTGDVGVRMGVLIGDVDANRNVSNTDVATIKTEVAAPLTVSNFRDDVNANGVISNTDVSATKAQVGTSLPSN